MREPALGRYIGFQAAWGYWISAWLGNVSNAVAIFGSLAYFFPFFGKGNNVHSVVGASIALWLVHALVLRGVKQAAFVNVVTTAAKTVPLVVFVILAVVGFNYSKFTLDFSGAAAAGPCRPRRQVTQVKSTMLVTLWVFIGIEGASVYSSVMRRTLHMGAERWIGFCGALAVTYWSLLSTGILVQKELAGLPVPSMAGVLESSVGAWGAALISIGLVISVGGAFLSWMMLCAEIPYVAAKDGNFPSWFAIENAAGSAAVSLWITNGLVQAFLIITLFAGSTYQFLYSIASVAILPPYVFSGAYALKLALSGETYEREPSRRNIPTFCGRAGDGIRALALLCRGSQVPAACSHSVCPRITAVHVRQARASATYVHGRGARHRTGARRRRVVRNLPARRRRHPQMTASHDIGDAARNCCSYLGVCSSAASSHRS